MQVSGSLMGLLPICQYFARDDVPRPKVRPKNKLGVRGTAGHKVIETHYEKRRPLLTAEGDAILASLPAGDRDFLRGAYATFLESRISRAPFRAERAFAYDVTTDTSRPLTLKARRGYAGNIDPAKEIPSTLDLVFYEAAAGTVHVGDIKVAAGNEARSILATGQLRFNALSAGRAYEARRAVVTEIHIGPDGVDPKQWEMGPGELDAEAAKVRALVERIPTSEPNPGMHCRDMWCPIVGSCPATIRWQAGLVPLRAGGAELSFSPQGPEQIEQAILAVKGLRAMADWLEANVNAVVDELPGQTTPLSDGRWYERREKVTRSIDLSVPGAEESLRAAGVGSAIVPEATIDRIKQAIRAAGYRGGEVDRIADKILEGLDSMGAIRGNPVVSHEITGKRQITAGARNGADEALQALSAPASADAEKDIASRPLLRI